MIKTSNINIVIVLENIRSVYNVGSIFRTLDGFGVYNVALVGVTPGPLGRFSEHRKDFAKVSLGAEKNIKYTHFEDINEVIHKYKGL